MLWLDLPGADAETSVDEIVEHYFGDTSEREVGHRTMMLRRAYRRVDKQQKRRYRGAIAGAVALLLISVVVGVYQFRELQQSRQIAIDMFYNMKPCRCRSSRSTTSRCGRSCAQWRRSTTTISTSSACWVRTWTRRIA